jgi:ligand-binding sensor domain-containing protein
MIKLEFLIFFNSQSSYRNKMKKIFLVFAFAFSSLLAQNFGTWQNYTDKRNIKDIKITAKGVWCASDGGAFFFNFNDSSFITLTKSEGLKSQEITAVTVDSENKIWLGTKEGYIETFDTSGNHIQTITDIATSNKKSKAINNIQVKGDTIFVATDFGISLISAKDFHFFDTITKFGDFPTEIKVNALVLDSNPIVATERGVAILKTGAKYFTAPDSWETYGFSESFFARNVFKAMIFQNDLVAATDTGLFRYRNGTWTRILFADYHVPDMSLYQDALYCLVGSKVYKFDGQNNTVFLRISGSKLTKIKANEGEFFIASNKGLLIHKDSTNTIYPNGPVQNFVFKLTTDKHGRVWTVSGKDPKGSGINMFDGSRWYNYNKNNTDAIHLNAYYSVFAAEDGRIFFANWGDGFTVFQNDSFYTYNADNTTLTGISQNPRYIPLTDIALDSKGNVWVLNLSNLNSQPISVLTANGEWHHYRFASPLSPSPAGVYHLAIDQYDTKWFTVAFDGIAGLYYFNENKTFDDLTDDVWGILQTNDGLNSNSINAIALDKQGELWIGTSLGVNIISDPANPRSRISSVFALRQQNITCIAVDPINRKWVGTNQGVFLMSPDGTFLIAQYNKDNSPLPSNNITSIATDPKSGKVYIATDFGISSLNTMAIKPQRSFSNITVYPNPFVIGKGEENKVYIKGLIQNTFVKIMTPEGEKIREYLSAPGGAIAAWDGKDENGNLVSSGIYLIILYDEEANNIAVAKVAVIRK